MAEKVNLKTIQMPGLDNTYVVNDEKELQKKLDGYVSKSDFEVHSEEYDWSLIRNKPEFANVAISGSYSDLIEKPDLADIALTGEFKDLKEVPPLREQATEEDYTEFDKQLEIPRKTSELINDKHFMNKLPIASKETLGAVKIGVGLRMINDVLNVTGEAIIDAGIHWINIVDPPENLSFFVLDDDFKKNFANVAFSGNFSELSNVPIASTDQLGVAKVDGQTITVNANGVLEAHGTSDVLIKTWKEE